MANKKPKCKKPPTSGVRPSKRYLSRTKKSIAIILRGHQKRHRYAHDAGQTPLDFDCTRGSIDSFINMVKKPLELKYNIYIYVVSPDNLYDNYLINKIKPIKIWHPPGSEKFIHVVEDLCNGKNIQNSLYKGENTQVYTFSYGAKKLLEEKEIDKFDHLLILRPDALYKKSINEWNINFNTTCVFPFYESDKEIKRAPDCIYWINKRKDNGIRKVLEVISNYDFPYELHGLIGVFDKKGIEYDFMTKESFVSATYGPQSCCKNPFYALSGRKYFFEDISHGTLYGKDWTPDWANDKTRWFGGL